MPWKFAWKRSSSPLGANEVFTERSKSDNSNVTVAGERDATDTDASIQSRGREKCSTDVVSRSMGRRRSISTPELPAFGSRAAKAGGWYGDSVGIDKQPAKTAGVTEPVYETIKVRSEPEDSAAKFNPTLTPLGTVSSVMGTSHERVHSLPRHFSFEHAPVRPNSPLRRGRTPERPKSMLGGLNLVPSPRSNTKQHGIQASTHENCNDLSCPASSVSDNSHCSDAVICCDGPQFVSDKDRGVPFRIRESDMSYHMSTKEPTSHVNLNTICASTGKTVKWAVVKSINIPEMTMSDAEEVLLQAEQGPGTFFFRRDKEDLILTMWDGFHVYHVDVFENPLDFGGALFRDFVRKYRGGASGLLPAALRCLVLTTVAADSEWSVSARSHFGSTHEAPGFPLLSAKNTPSAYDAVNDHQLETLI